jgi:hypothetical protein
MSCGIKSMHEDWDTYLWLCDLFKEKPKTNHIDSVYLWNKHLNLLQDRVRANTEHTFIRDSRSFTDCKSCGLHEQEHNEQQETLKAVKLIYPNITKLIGL